MTDSKTLDKIITELSSGTSSIERKPIVVLDAGIATNDNLKLLEKNHIKYVCVSRSGMSKYPSIQRHYEIEVQTDEKKIVNNLIWKQKPVENKDGYYLLRTNLDPKDEEVQWAIYNVIKEIEATFRILKTDLDLRPIYHKTDGASMGHLHLGLLAYWVVNTIRYRLKQKPPGTKIIFFNQYSLLNLWTIKFLPER